jgi:hypothetical protein
MKKIAIIVVLGLVLAGTLSAQVFAPTVEKRTISGTLAVANGQIAVQTEDQTYYAYGFQHLINFVDGLKEGSNVTL